MDTQNLEKELHVSRYIIIYKFILGLIELILGLGILFFTKQIYEVYLNFKTEELLEDPHDLLGNILEKVIPYVSQHQGYIVLILLTLGLVKIAGAIGLIYGKHWGLDLLVGLTLLLLPFEGYSLAVHPSVEKFAYFFINILIALYLVNFQPKEYFSKLNHRIRR